MSIDSLVTSEGEARSAWAACPRMLERGSGAKAENTRVHDERPMGPRQKILLQKSINGHWRAKNRS
eukprot:1985086-Pleurochrysis_carterae.AAC.2